MTAKSHIQTDMGLAAETPKIIYCPNGHEINITKIARLVQLGLKVLGMGSVQCNQKRRLDFKYKFVSSVKELADKDQKKWVLCSLVTTQRSTTTKSKRRITLPTLQWTINSQSSFTHHTTIHTTNNNSTIRWATTIIYRVDLGPSSWGRGNCQHSTTTQKAVHSFLHWCSHSTHPSSAHLQGTTSNFEIIKVSRPLPDIPVGGQLHFFTLKWYTITKDPEIIQMVVSCPINVNENIDHNRLMKELKFSEEEMHAADEQIEQLLAKNAIQKSPHEKGEFVSNVFLCPKKDGGYRMILNLKKFNKFIEKVHFKMETIDTILQLVTPNCFMTKIYLSNAYLIISVFFEHRKLLKFYWRGQLFMFMVITKLLKPIVAYLCSLGFIITFYLDDSWQKEDSYEEYLLNCETTYNLLQMCGFIPNDKKSVLIPTRKLEIRGHIVNSKNMCVSLPPNKTQTVIDLCTELLIKPMCTIRHLAKVIGCLISCTRVCVLSNLYYRSLERTKLNTLCEQWKMGQKSYIKWSKHSWFILEDIKLTKSYCPN